MSPRARRLVRILHPDIWPDAAALLERECGRGLPLCADATDDALDRLRFAALKVAAGDAARLREAVELAKVDWRDLLVWAGFADDLGAHRGWAEQLPGKE